MFFDKFCGQVKIGIKSDQRKYWVRFWLDLKTQNFLRTILGDEKNYVLNDKLNLKT